MDHIWKELQLELEQGIHAQGHPFKFATLGTVDSDFSPQLRTVVLRNILENGTIWFYTDRRSNKVDQIHANPKVSLLCYHPEKLLQLRMEGLATITTDMNELSPLWNTIPEHNKMDYLTTRAPGSALNHADTLEYLNGDHYFSRVEFEPLHIEYLKLGRPRHTRVRFTRKDASWEGAYLVP